MSQMSTGAIINQCAASCLDNSFLYLIALLNQESIVAWELGKDFAPDSYFIYFCELWEMAVTSVVFFWFCLL